MKEDQLLNIMYQNPDRSYRLQDFKLYPTKQERFEIENNLEQLERQERIKSHIQRTGTRLYFLPHVYLTYGMHTVKNRKIGKQKVSYY